MKLRIKFKLRIKVTVHPSEETKINMSYLKTLLVLITNYHLTFRQFCNHVNGKSAPLSRTTEAVGNVTNFLWFLFLITWQKAPEPISTSSHIIHLRIFTSTIFRLMCDAYQIVKKPNPPTPHAPSPTPFRHHIMRLFGTNSQFSVQYNQ